MKKAIEQILNKWVPDWNQHPDFKDTPKRVDRMYNELFYALTPEADKEILYHLEKRFPTNNDQMISFRDIDTVSICPHHLLPIEYRVSVAYIPNKEAIGLSKIVRISKILARQPIIQENYTTKLANFIEENLNPQGVMVHIKGYHGCMSFRGVNEKTEVITSHISGAFQQDETRQEFLNLINK